MEIKKILDKYSDCDTFSLTGQICDYDCSDEELDMIMNSTKGEEREKILEKHYIRFKVTEDDYLNALNQLEKKQKNKLENYYDKNIKKLKKYPNFEELYNEIEKECYDYCNKKNKKKITDMFFHKEAINSYKIEGYSDSEIKKIKDDFFKCSFIADDVGKKTKYGKEDTTFFWNFYSDVGFIIDRKREFNKSICNDGKNPIFRLPNELKDNLIKYEIQFFNSVTVCNRLMINYYFKLNNESKKYLLRYKSDFDLDDLEDLSMFKNNKLLFYSCTHEHYNSFEL